MSALARETALAAVDAGISVVPPRQDGSKAPIGEWEPYQHERPTLAQIEAWYSSPERTGVGFVGGKVSGGLELLEFEGRAARAGIVGRFMGLARQRGLGDLVEVLCRGYSEKSPSEGLHLLYRCTETGSVKLAKSAEGKDLIETKGEGGYMIVAPTNGKVHPTGGAYQMLQGGIDTIPTISPTQRRQLFDLAAEFDEREPPAEEIPVTPSGKQDGWVSAVIADYNTRTIWADVLAGRFTQLFTRKDITYWHFEGAENHISATTNAKGTDRLIVFSGTAQGAGWRIHQPAPGRKAPSYDRFSARVLIDTGSHDVTDRVRIAGELQAAGYGPPGQRNNLTVLLPPPKVDPDTGEIGATPPAVATRLPDEFWNARPRLTQVRRAAHARQRSADAVLHVVLARIAAITPHTTLLPAIVGSPKPLCYFAAPIAPPGVGKSDANSIGCELVPAPGYVADQLPLGSGEGLAEVLFDLVEELDDNNKKRTVKRQIRHNAYVFVDEGQILGEIGGRSGATLLPTLRSIWTGGVLGQSNASRERHRVVPALGYTYGVVAGFQAARVGPLLDDVGSGLPERFGWVYATDPTVPDERPDWPGSLDWTPPARISGGLHLEVAPAIETEIRSADLARIRGETTTDPLDAHAGLYRIKVAGLLAVLDGRADVSLEDWALAGMVKTASDAIRTNVVNALAYEQNRKEQAARERHARREVEADTATHRTRVVDGARKIAGKVWKEPEQWTARRLRNEVARRWRDVFDDALDHALAEDWVIEITEPGQGTDKRSLRPGEKRP